MEELSKYYNAGQRFGKERVMRTSVKVELDMIRTRRNWKLKLLIKLFPRQFNSFANAHLSRAYEVSEIGSKTLHSITHYVGADCGLPGHGV